MTPQIIRQIDTLTYLIDTTRNEARKNALRRQIEELEYKAYCGVRYDA